jgi:hypothetical protein
MGIEGQEAATTVEGATPDPFEAAFNEAAEAGEKEQSGSQAQKPTVDGADKKEEVTEKKAEEPAAPPEKKEAAKPEEAVKPPDTVSKEDFDKLTQQFRSLQGMYNSLVKKTETPPKTEEGGKGKEPTTPAPAAAMIDDKFFDDLYSDLSKAEKDIISLTDAEFDVITKAVDLKTAHALKKTVGALQKSVSDMVTAELTKLATAAKKRMDQIESRVAKADDDTHFSVVREAHPDYQKYVEDGSLSSWIDSLSPSRKKAYTEIYNNGEASEVVEMLRDFKEAKGITKKEEKKEEEEVVTKKDDDKVRQLESIKGKSTGVNPVGVTSGKAQDYDAAWDEALGSR